MQLPVSKAGLLLDNKLLASLPRDDFDHYLTHRLQVAGWRGESVFGRTARWLLWRASKGVPRRANILAHKSLMLAYGRGVHKVVWRDAWAAINDETTSGWWMPLRLLDGAQS